jgi:phytoene dehydrogenase-like protein
MAAAIVVGDGIDALVAAHSLAKAGHDVTLVREDTPPASQAGWVPPQIVSALDLARHGFQVQGERAWARVALDDGSTLELTADIAESAAAIHRLSPHDADRWPQFCVRMHEAAKLLESIYTAPPPDPLSSDVSELVRLARAGLRFRRLGRERMADLLRLLPMSIADLLDDWFESDALKGALGAAGVISLCQGPRSGGTAFSFLHHHVGSAAGVFRPPRTNAERALRARPGLTVREGNAARIVTREGRVAAVALATGEEIGTDVVVSAFDPRRTLIEMSDPGELDPQLVRSVRNVRSRGVAAEVTLELERGGASSNLVLAPSLDHLERAYDDVKYGRTSDRPCIETHADDSEAHRLHVRVQYVHDASDAATRDAQRASLGEAVRGRLAQHVRAFADAAVAGVVTPRDLEERHGFPQGQPYHAELALDQVLWMRPVPELAQYRTPIDGLYLCGPAMHPGAGIAGAAGANAASVVVRDLKRRKKR